MARATWKRPPSPAASAEGAELRTAFSLALRYVIVRRGGRDVATPPPEPPPAPPALERQHRDALRSLPGLRLWVATAPHAAATAAGSWAPFPPEPSAPLPLLADDTAKAGQLSGDLAVSFVQVLTHAVAAAPPLAAANSERARARDALLRQIDTDLLALLRVPRLSADGFELTTAPRPPRAARRRQRLPSCSSCSRLTRRRWPARPAASRGRLRSTSCATTSCGARCASRRCSAARSPGARRGGTPSSRQQDRRRVSPREGGGRERGLYCHLKMRRRRCCCRRTRRCRRVCSPSPTSRMSAPSTN